MNRTTWAASAAAALVVIGALSACSAPSAPEAASDPPATATPEPTAAPEPKTSDRGHIIKSIGELGGFGVNDPLDVGFTITSIEIDPACTGEYTMPPERGHFIVIGIDVETTPAAEGDFGASADSWKIVDSEGVTVNGSLNTGPAWGCLSESEKAPPQVGIASKVSGKIVLDSPVASGTLIFIPSYNYMVGSTGWEWQF